MTIEVPLKVFRYKPGSEPHYESYRVTLPDEANMIDAIEAVWSQHDRTFMFRHACHHASCGTCAVRINGVEKLPCIVPVREVWRAGQEILLEPLRNFPIVGDLVVDVTGFFQKQVASGMLITRQAEPTLDGKAYVRTDILNAEAQWESRPYNRFQNCIECGICISACPTMATSDKFLGPAALAGVHRALQEAGDQPHRSLLLALADGEHGAWRCHSGWECTEACPQNVDPAGAIMALRRELIAHKVKKLFGARV